MNFLPGVPASYVSARLEAAGGNEIGSGKLASPESSAALAVNCFGWFHDRPAQLPSFGEFQAGFPALKVDIEYCARFPWSGGRHPWLDAAVVTRTHLIGVESKRFEPFRDKKTVSYLMPMTGRFGVMTWDRSKPCVTICAPEISALNIWTRLSWSNTRSDWSQMRVGKT